MWKMFTFRQTTSGMTSVENASSLGCSTWIMSLGNGQIRRHPRYTKNDARNLAKTIFLFILLYSMLKVALEKVKDNFLHHIRDFVSF